MKKPDGVIFFHRSVRIKFLQGASLPRFLFLEFVLSQPMRSPDVILLSQKVSSVDSSSQALIGFFNSDRLADCFLL